MSLQGPSCKGRHTSDTHAGKIVEEQSYHVHTKEDRDGDRVSDHLQCTMCLSAAGFTQCKHTNDLLTCSSGGTSMRLRCI